MFYQNLGYIVQWDAISSKFNSYKSINGLTHPANYFVTAQNSNYNLRSNGNLRPMLFGSTQGQSSPSFYCSHLWNNIPPYIKLKSSISSFKLSLKQYLLNRYRTWFISLFWFDFFVTEETDVNVIE